MIRNFIIFIISLTGLNGIAQTIDNLGQHFYSKECIDSIFEAIYTDTVRVCLEPITKTEYLYIPQEYIGLFQQMNATNKRFIFINLIKKEELEKIKNRTIKDVVLDENKAVFQDTRTITLWDSISFDYAIQKIDNLNIPNLRNNRSCFPLHLDLLLYTLANIQNVEIMVEYATNVHEISTIKHIINNLKEKASITDFKSFNQLHFLHLYWMNYTFYNWDIPKYNMSTDSIGIGYIDFIDYTEQQIDSLLKIYPDNYAVNYHKRELIIERVFEETAKREREKYMNKISH